MIEPGWKMFDITLIDLQKGEQRILDRDPFTLNPHPPFEPGEGRTLMIQHNRGGKYSPDGQLERLIGPEGATLYVLSVPEGRRTNWQSARRTLLPAPATKPGSGPRAKCCCPCRPAASSVPEKGNLLAVHAGQPPRVVARGYRFNHVGASRCGRLFSADDWQPPCKIVIGSTQAERAAVICESKTAPTRSQNTHPQSTRLKQDNLTRNGKGHSTGERRRTRQRRCRKSTSANRIR